MYLAVYAPAPGLVPQFLVVVNLCAGLMVLLGTYYGGPDGITWFNSMKWVDFAAISAPLTWYHSAYWVITVVGFGGVRGEGWSGGRGLVGGEFRGGVRGWPDVER